MHRNLARQLSIFAPILALSLLGSAFVVGCSQETPLAPEEPTPVPDPGPGPDPGPTPDPSATTVSLEWDPPTRNADGSQPLSDLAGYTLHYGMSPSELDQQVDTGASNQVDLTLDFGTWYFAVTARDTWGNVSEASETLELFVQPAPPQERPGLRDDVGDQEGWTTPGGPGL